MVKDTVKDTQRSAIGSVYKTMQGLGESRCHWRLMEAEKWRTHIDELKEEIRGLAEAADRAEAICKFAENPTPAPEKARNPRFMDIRYDPNAETPGCVVCDAPVRWVTVLVEPRVEPDFLNTTRIVGPHSEVV